jgi:cystathionine gamma-synthase
MKLETRAVHAGHGVDPTTGALAQAWHPSTTYERDADGSYPRGFLYSRNANPNRAALERGLAELEGGGAAAAFASGTAAAAAILGALAPGDHIIAPHDMYHGTVRLVREHMERWGMSATFVDVTDPARVQAALRPATRLIWVETPSNPMLTVTDLARVAELAHGAQAIVVCDNTLATPVHQRPLELGVDLVKHSTTKYLGGHADVMGGAVVARSEGGFFEKVRWQQANLGAIPAPFDCWLLLRSLPTLPWRMRGHSANALAVAGFLRAHSRVEAVHYPGLPDHPNHAVAVRQMTGGFGGLLSFQVRGGRDAALAVAGRLQLITRATSYGSVESLIEHRASIEGPQSRTPQSLLRLSVGLEHPDDLVEDLAQALK